MGLFGPQGMLSQIREGEAQQAKEILRREAHVREEHIMMPLKPRPAGAPNNGAKREADRAAAKEAKIQMMLEEREARLGAAAAEAKEKRALVRNAAQAASAPAFTTANLLGVNEDRQTQQQRVQAKMEILKMLNGYGNLKGQASVEQTQAMIAKLQEDMNGGGNLWSSDCGSDVGQEENVDQPSVQARLQQINDSCNQAFEELHEL